MIQYQQLLVVQDISCKAQLQLAWSRSKWVLILRPTRRAMPWSPHLKSYALTWNLPSSGQQIVLFKPIWVSWWQEALWTESQRNEKTRNPQRNSKNLIPCLQAQTPCDLRVFSKEKLTCQAALLFYLQEDCCRHIHQTFSWQTKLKDRKQMTSFVDILLYNPRLIKYAELPSFSSKYANTKAVLILDLVQFSCKDTSACYWPHQQEGKGRVLFNIRQ